MRRILTTTASQNIIKAARKHANRKKETQKCVIKKPAHRNGRNAAPHGAAFFCGKKKRNEKCGRVTGAIIEILSLTEEG